MLLLPLLHYRQLEPELAAAGRSAAPWCLLLLLARLLLLQREYLTALCRCERQQRCGGGRELAAPLPQNNHLAARLLLNDHGRPPLLTVPCSQHLTHKYGSARS